MSYNWEKIFTAKDENELIKIYSGGSLLNYEASIYAGLELKKRGFDFELIQDIHRQKVNELKTDIEQLKNIKFINSKYFKNQVLGGIVIIGIIFFLFNNGLSLYDQNNIQLYRQLIILTITIIGVLTAKWNFTRFKRKREKAIEKKLILLKKITMPNN